MKKTTVLAMVVSCLAAGPALAAPTVSVTQTAGYFSGLGGEFFLTPNQELQNITSETGTYSSFCLEFNEAISAGTTYDVAVATEALGGGVNNGPTGPQGGDALDPMTAYLYTQFRTGTLAGYDYNPAATRAASAGALQDVIWFIEDEQAKTWTDGDNSLQDQFYQDAVNAGWTNIGNVRVLNLYTQGHLGEAQHYIQDQLALAVPIPAPGAMLLGGLGASLVGWLRRRKSF